MASSGKPKRSSGLARGLASHVAGRLKKSVQPGDHLVLGLSGGIDSMVLLDVLARLSSRARFNLRALHVDHQLSPNSAAWARFCRRACRSRGVPCRVLKVDVPRANSVERAAREARYAAFAQMRAQYIVLAHNADDQAETVLLQLLRGAGVKGLAAMPFMRTPNASTTARQPAIIRPLLDVPRVDIERYARRRKLEWIEDESNVDARYTRNWARRELLPRIAERLPAYRSVLTRAARNMGEASALLDELARIDAAKASDPRGLCVEALRALSPARAKNLLRFLIDSYGWRMPDASRLTEALRQALHARADSNLAVSLGSCELRRHRGFVHLVAARTHSAADRLRVIWRGQREIALPDAGGVLEMARARGAGMSALRLESQPVTIRRRQGGERLQADAKRPRRSVKNLLQEAGVPTWQRERLPFIYCGDDLVCIPGVAVDWRFLARRGERGIVPSWRETDT